MIKDKDGFIDLKATAYQNKVMMKEFKQAREVARGKLLTAIGGGYEGALNYALYRASKYDHSRIMQEMFFYQASLFKPENFKWVFFRAFQRIMNIQNAQIEADNAEL